MGQVSKATQQKAGELPDKNLYVAICAQETTVVSDTELPLTNPTQCLNDGEKQPLDEDGSSLRVTQSDRKIGRDDAQKLEKKGCQLFGVEMSPDTVAIAMVYFVQGILSLPLLAVNFFLKDDLHLDPAEATLLSRFSDLPWLIKPIYGFMSDGLPLFGYRRRSYLVLCGLVGALSWGTLATVVNNKYAAIATIFLSSLSVAFSDVVVDSMVVERARGESQGTSGSLQSLCWGSSAMGGIVSAYFSGYLVEKFGVRFVFGVTALLPLITSVVAGLVHEKPFHMSGRVGLQDSESAEPDETGAPIGFLETSKIQLGYLWEIFKEPNIHMPTLFILLLQATPTSDKAMFFFLTNKLEFQPEFLGRVQLVVAVATLAGVAVYNSFLKHVNLKKMFLWTTILGTLLGLTQLLLVTGMNRTLGISDKWFSVGDSLVLSVLAQVSFMPILVLAARLCPPGVEATLFATLMSIYNGGTMTGGLLGAGLTKLLGVTAWNFHNLALLLVICNVSSLLPLPFLGLLPSEAQLEAAVEKAEKTLDQRRRWVALEEMNADVPKASDSELLVQKGICKVP